MMLELSSGSLPPTWKPRRLEVVAPVRGGHSESPVSVTCPQSAVGQGRADFPETVGGMVGWEGCRGVRGEAGEF